MNWTGKDLLGCRLLPGYLDVYFLDFYGMYSHTTAKSLTLWTGPEDSKEEVNYSNSWLFRRNQKRRRGSETLFLKDHMNHNFGAIHIHIYIYILKSSIDHMGIVIWYMAPNTIIPISYMDHKRC